MSGSHDTTADHLSTDILRQTNHIYEQTTVGSRILSPQHNQQKPQQQIPLKQQRPLKQQQDDRDRLAA